jgi:hypothetical protein
MTLWIIVGIIGAVLLSNLFVTWIVIRRVMLLEAVVMIFLPPRNHPAGRKTGERLLRRVDDQSPT